MDWRTREHILNTLAWILGYGAIAALMAAFFLAMHLWRIYQ